MPNYGFDVVGRWIGHMAHGRFLHKPIFTSPPIPGEIIGWIAHYALGAAFGFLPILLGGGAGWIANPTWLAAISGPAHARGALLHRGSRVRHGRALCARADPWAARRQGVIAHLYYGVALYIAAVLVAMLMRLSTPFSRLPGGHRTGRRPGGATLCACTMPAPTRINPTPTRRPNAMGLGANPIRPKWSITSDASICPAITLTMKLAAPNGRQHQRRRQIGHAGDASHSHAGPWTAARPWAPAPT